MKRTGSIGSRVPPAVTTTWRPVEVRVARPAATSGGRAAGSGARTGRSPTAATTASTIAGEVGQPPDARLARRERPGVRLDDRVAEVVAQAARRWPASPGGVHMSPSIAGATTTGADGREAGGGHDVAGQAVGHRAEPVGGRRRDDDRRRPCRRRRCGRSGRRAARSSTSVSTGWRDSAANDSGPTKRAADGVSMTATSAPSARRRRSSSTAL